MEASIRTGHLAKAFLSNLTHELRTPLSVIIGTIPLFSEQILGPLNEKQLGFMRSLSDSAQSLSIMVNDLLLMSELQAGRLQLVLQPVDFPELVGHVIRTLEPLAEANSQDLVNEVPASLPNFMGDAQKLNKVLTNLIGNAVKFTHGGGKIRVAAESREDSMVVTISDTGPGLSEEEQALLFQAFGQIHPDRTGGLGLGLAICKAFVEAHGGAIGVESRKGQGSTFWLTLPVSPHAAGAPLRGAG
jgi:signal transduction histidine kinase